MKQFFRLYTIEQKLFFRSPDVFIFNLCMPVFLPFLSQSQPAYSLVTE